jgi:hypothetical protein
LSGVLPPSGPEHVQNRADFWLRFQHLYQPSEFGEFSDHHESRYTQAMLLAVAEVMAMEKL